MMLELNYLIGRKAAVTLGRVVNMHTKVVAYTTYQGIISAVDLGLKCFWFELDSGELLVLPFDGTQIKFTNPLSNYYKDALSPESQELLSDPTPSAKH
jgi:hypothetical protein